MARLHARVAAAQLFRLLDRNPIYFKTRVEEQFARSQESACRELVMEISPVHLVESVVKTDVGTKDLDGNEIVHRHAGGLDGVLDRVHDKTRFILSIGSGFASLGIHADVAGDV